VLVKGGIVVISIHNGQTCDVGDTDTVVDTVVDLVSELVVELFSVEVEVIFRNALL